MRTVTAVIGIKGTGVYLEADSEKPTCVPVTGLPICSLGMPPKISETVTTSHHDQPRFIYSGEKRIEQAPVINHSDQELILLEKLVGRIPPFVKPNRNDGGKSSKSDSPYSSNKYGY